MTIKISPLHRTVTFLASVCVSLAALAFDPLSASIAENLATPAVKPKESPAVVAAMGNLQKALKNANYTADTTRSGEVVMVTIPCAELFAPNSGTLLPSAPQKLKGLVPYVKRTDNFKVIIAVHADDTGDDLYAEQITTDRANAVDEYFFSVMNEEDTGIIPYGLGNDEPVAANTSVKNRAKNRRVEIYFVPTEDFIDKSKRKK